MGVSTTQNSFWILTVLARGRRHGYDIIQEAAKLFGGSVALKVTTLYTTLDYLETEGFILKDSKEIIDGRTRRYYRLNDEGADALDDKAKALEIQASITKARLIGMRSLGTGACPSVPCVTP